MVQIVGRFEMLQKQRPDADQAPRRMIIQDRREGSLTDNTAYSFGVLSGGSRDNSYLSRFANV